MRKTSLLLLTLAVGACGGSDEIRLDAPPEPEPSLSAARAPGHTYDDSVSDNRDALDEGKADGTSIVYDRQALLENVDLSSVPVWTQDQLAQGFALVRDSRFMLGVPPEDFARRASFLFPDDGCYARAQAMDFWLGRNGLPRPVSVFSFGELTVQTANHPDGQVSWWFHVAPIVSVDGQAYVLDPSLEPTRPLLLAEWIGLQGDPGSIGVSVCSGYVFSPNGNCDQPAKQESGFTIISNEYWFLEYEWNRQLDLGRDPNEVLGDAPPWAAP
jgi:glutaminase-like protein